MTDQEQNTVQTQEVGTDDFATWEAQRNAELTGQSGAGEEQPAAESAEETETSETKEEPKGEEPKGENPEGEEEGEKPKDEEKPKRKGGFQKKIDALTRKNYELAERLAALEKGESVEPEAKPAADKPKSEDFDDFDQFADALTDWKLRQHDTAKATKEAEAKAKAEAETRKQKAAENWNERVGEARKQFEDYDAVLEGAEDIEVPQELEAALLEAGPAVLYHFAKHPDEAERIAELPTTSALREIGKIEARIAAESAKEPTPKTQPTKKTTSAPKPVRSLTGNAAQTKGLDDPDIPYSEWEKQRNRKLLQGR